MDKPSHSQAPNSERLGECLSRQGKSWWRRSLALKVISFVIGIIALLLPVKFQGWLPFVLLAVALTAEIFNYNADRILSMAQSFRAKLDFQDSLDWRISPAEYSDFLAEIPQSVKDAAQRPPSALERQGNYFESPLAQGPQRALENVEESAWWSKHLAREMVKYSMIILIASLMFTILALVVTIYAASITGSQASSAGLSGMARGATSFLMLLLSLGMLKLTLGYHSFRQKAEKVEKHAGRLLASGAAEIMDAVKTVHEYHLARIVAPIMPEWIWRLKQKELNILFKQRREAQRATPSISH